TGDTTTSPLVGADSMKLTLTITRRDTTAHNLTVRLYRLPITIDSTTTFADLRGAFADPIDSLRAVNVDALLAKPGGVDSATGDQAAIDTTSKFLKVTVKLDSLQAPYVSGDSGKLGVGVRIGADAPTSVGFCTRENACGASLAWFVKVDSIKGTDTTLIHKQLAAVTLFDSYVFDPPIPPVYSTPAVGGGQHAARGADAAVPGRSRASHGDPVLSVGGGAVSARAAHHLRAALPVRGAMTARQVDPKGLPCGRGWTGRVLLGAAVLLSAGTPVRLSAQDSQFGVRGLGTPGRFETARARSTGGA